MGRHLRPVALSLDITLAEHKAAWSAQKRMSVCAGLCESLHMWNCILVRLNVRYYDDWEAITFIRSVKVKHVFPGEANAPLRFTEGNDISPFWQGVLKSEMGIDAETKHTSGVRKAWIINLSLEDGDRHLEPYNTEPSKVEGGWILNNII